MQDKQYFINCYNNAIYKIKQEYIKECGNDNNFNISLAQGELCTANEIVGYYIVYHGDNSLKQWLDNLEYIKQRNWEGHITDEEVTMILQQLFAS